MRSQLLHDHAGLRTFAVVFETGDEVIEGLTQFASDNRISGAQLTAIGAFSRVIVGFFEFDRKDYRRLTLDEQVEVLSLTGTIGVRRSSEGGQAARDQPALHVHVVLGRRDGTACGGHLLEGRVRPTLEVIATETPGHLRRRFNPETGLALIDVRE